MTVPRTTAILAALALATAAVTAQEARKPGMSFSGNLAYDTAVAYTATAAHLPYVNPGWSQGVRYTLSAINTERSFAKVEASIEAGFVQGLAAQAALAQLAAFLPPEAADALGTIEAVPVFSLRKLYAQLDFGPIMLSGGRQIINRGRGQFFSPADLFSESDLSGLTPRRIGSDSVTILVPIADVNGLEFSGRPKTDLPSGLYQARLFGNLAGIDAAVHAARDGGAKEWKFGADCKFDLEVSLYGEALVTAEGDFTRADFSGMAGLDWSIEGTWFFVAEYYFNGSPVDPSLSENFAERFPLSHYAAAIVRYAPDDILSFQGYAIVCPEKLTGTFTLSASWSASQSASVTPFIGLSKGTLSGISDDTTVSGGLSIAVKM